MPAQQNMFDQLLLRLGPWSPLFVCSTLSWLTWRSEFFILMLRLFIHNYTGDCMQSMNVSCEHDADQNDRADKRTRSTDWIYAHIPAGAGAFRMRFLIHLLRNGRAGGDGGWLWKRLVKHVHVSNDYNTRRNWINYSKTILRNRCKFKYVEVVIVVSVRMNEWMCGVVDDLMLSGDNNNT